MRIGELAKHIGISADWLAGKSARVRCRPRRGIETGIADTTKTTCIGFAALCSAARTGGAPNGGRGFTMNRLPETGRHTSAFRTAGLDRGQASALIGVLSTPRVKPLHLQAGACLLRKPAGQGAPIGDPAVAALTRGRLEAVRLVRDKASSTLRQRRETSDRRKQG